MADLVYAYPDFTAFTKIKSAEVNSKFQSIADQFNTTNKINRSAIGYGTANHVVINGSDGALSSEASLAVSRGGTGLSISLSAADAAKVVQVNTAGSALTLDVVPEGPGGKVFNFYRFA
jgi:hypothetical protein